MESLTTGPELENSQGQTRSFDDARFTSRFPLKAGVGGPIYWSTP
jgi:hypothetical protein